jgi:hypothetical protein
MSRPQLPPPAKLVISVLTAQRDLIVAVCEDLTQAFGPPDLVSDWWDFDFTEYYTPEMGAPLSRRMVAFETLVHQGDLARIKHRTNALEDRYAVDQQRRVNLDPGLLLQERFILATGKNFSHRIYLADGIYADLTLMYVQGAYQGLPWTYPDYRQENMRSYLQHVRAKYRSDLKHAQAEQGV